MKRLVIFDFDGTLLDSAQGVTDSMNAALGKLGLDAITLKDTKKYISDGIGGICDFAAKSDPVLSAECQRLFMEDYIPKASKVNPLFDGVGKLLDILSKMGIRIAILTNKPYDAAKDIIENLLGRYTIDYLAACKDGKPPKPDGTGVDEIVNFLKVNREDTVLVGDTEIDAKTANNAGIDFIGVLWGNRSKRQLKNTGAKYFAKDTDRLFNLIMYKFGKTGVSKFFTEFKKFVTKGNIMDLAIGVVVGAAFTAIVNSLVKDIITPVISLLTRGIVLNNLKLVIREAETEIVDGAEKIITPALTVNYGAFIQAVINFMLIAITVFTFIRAAVSVRTKLDYNANMRGNIQQKLDADQPLTRREKKWMIKQKKVDKENLPRKTLPPPPPKPKEPDLTDKLLMEILDELKTRKK